MGSGDKVSISGSDLSEPLTTQNVGRREGALSALKTRDSSLSF